MRLFNSKTNLMHQFLTEVERQERQIYADSNIVSPSANPYLCTREHASFWQQPCFKKFNTFSEVQTALQTAIAKPILCSWLSFVYMQRLALELTLVSLFFFTLGWSKLGNHFNEAVGSLFAAFYFDGLSTIYSFTEPLEFLLRLAVTAGDNLMHAFDDQNSMRTPSLAGL